jgi:hypothetical protein
MALCRLCVISLLMLFIPLLAHPADTGSAQFSDDVAAQLLDRIRDGLEGHNPDRMLGVFDPAKFSNYAAFRDQVRALFQKYETFRVSYQIMQSWPNVERGVLLVNFEMEATPRGGSLPAEHRGGQVRIEIEHVPRGWKLTGLVPRDLFS